jgi:hypothetical protein
MEEQWRAYAKNPKLEVSNMGNVRATGRTHTIPPNHCGKHHTIVALGGVFNLRYMVAEMWVPNTHSRSCVRHINGDTHDNRASNLEWYSPLRKGGRPKKDITPSTDSSSWEDKLDRIPFPDDPASVHTPEAKNINTNFIVQAIANTGKWLLFNTITHSASVHDSFSDAVSDAERNSKKRPV